MAEGAPVFMVVGVEDCATCSILGAKLPRGSVEGGNESVLMLLVPQGVTHKLCSVGLLHVQAVGLAALATISLWLLSV